ncbi:hypothetical protein IFM89_030735 [Coptis chinensis]|uniref:ABC transporter domain-containing protein n=1 Tax=Coptis chinensis TaxID=261450 RepID=A0A835J0L7_9MAGN|nr:hypothetical protein IFM89_030735 [Coptis chinensis]
MRTAGIEDMAEVLEKQLKSEISNMTLEDALTLINSRNLDSTSPTSFANSKRELAPRFETFSQFFACKSPEKATLLEIDKISFFFNRWMRIGVVAAKNGGDDCIKSYDACTSIFNKILDIAGNVNADSHVVRFTCRVVARSQVSGRITYNGHGMDEFVPRRNSAYILGLDICADTMVGNVMIRGISGGQKKRVTTGEMLVGPAKAFFMDEISTGLDSSTTFQIVNALRQSVHILGGTAMIALLQPAPETYDLFDDIVLLSDGHIVYQGPRENVLEFFESLGFKCPERKGVADFLQEEFAETFQSFHVGHKLGDELSTPFDKRKSHPAALTTSKFGISKNEMFKACLEREWLLMKRNSIVYISQMVQQFQEQENEEMGSRPVVPNQPRGGAVIVGGGTHKAGAAEGNNRRALINVTNRGVDGRGIDVNPITRPVTRNFCAQIISKPQETVTENNNKKQIVVVVDGHIVGKEVAAIRKVALKNVTVRPKPEKVIEISPDTDTDTEEEKSEIRRQSREASPKKKKVHTLTSVLTARSKAACGITNKPKDAIIDIDAADADNHLAAVDYVEDIYKYYKLAENSS